MGAWPLEDRLLWAADREYAASIGVVPPTPLLPVETATRLAEEGRPALLYDATLRAAARGDASMAELYHQAWLRSLGLRRNPSPHCG